jgi:hypothetical protein
MDGCQPFCHHLLQRLLVAADLPRNDELIVVAPLRSSPKMRSHVLVDMPNLSTISIGASEDIMESHLKSRIMTCICPTSCPISTAPESLYGSPIHNPCPALAIDSAINHTCLAVDGRNVLHKPLDPPLIQSALLQHHDVVHTSHLDIHFIDECFFPVHWTLGSIASSSSPLLGLRHHHHPGIHGTVLPHSSLQTDLFLHRI